MKRILIIVGVVLVVLIGAVAILPQLIPSDVYRTRIESAASEALGREVKVSGDIKVSIFPRIEARAGGATVANPPGFGETPFASMKELRAAVKLIPLIFRRVEVDEFVLVEPSIALVKLESGANNWTFDIGQPPAKPDQPRPAPNLNASLGDVRIVQGLVSYDDRALKQVQTVSNLDLKADMKALDKPFSIAASGLANTLPFKVDTRIDNPKAMIEGAASPVTVKLDTDVLATNLDGTLALGETPTFDFKFEGQIPSAPKLADAFKMTDLPARAVLGRISASGQAFGSPSDITLKVADARHESDLLNADFNGEVRIAEFIQLQLTASADAPRLADLASAMKIEAPAAGALGKATATTKISGRLGDLKFTDVNFRHDSGLLGITFAGDASLSSDLAYSGRLTLSAPDLKQLASAAGAKLPAGDVYRSFSLTGDTSGSTRDVMLRNAVLEFDDIRGTGEAAVTFAGKPRLTGTLATGMIDATPYATASGAPANPETKKTGGWGNDPIDLSPLKLADADLTLKAAGLKFQKFDFGASAVAVTLRDGKLTADLKQTSLFGGTGGATIIADGGGAVPAFSVKANLDSLSLKPFMLAAAGFENIEGDGDLQLDFTGSGGTLQTLMSSLAGSGKFDFGNGAIKGVNLPELVKTAQSALTTKSISLSAFGPNAQTSFNDLKASFKMQDGVAAMADLGLDAGPMTVTGGGSLDIGKQSLAFSLFPEFKDKNEGVKGYGLPVKLAGGWGGVKASFDYDFLAQRAVSDVKAKVTNEIEKELSKQLGGNLSSILGVGAKPAGQTPAADSAAPAAPSDPAAPAAQPAPTAPAETAEERLRREAEKALGGLFRN
jgi:AsmA protein